MHMKLTRRLLSNRQKDTRLGEWICPKILAGEYLGRLLCVLYVGALSLRTPSRFPFPSTTYGNLSRGEKEINFLTSLSRLLRRYYAGSSIVILLVDEIETLRLHFGSRSLSSSYPLPLWRCREGLTNPNVVLIFTNAFMAHMTVVPSQSRLQESWANSFSRGYLRKSRQYPYKHLPPSH